MGLAGDGGEHDSRRRAGRTDRCQGAPHDGLQRLDAQALVEALELIAGPDLTDQAGQWRSNIEHKALKTQTQQRLGERAGDAQALAAAGARIIATDDPAPAGAYAFRSGEVTVVPISADAPPENANDVARAVLAAARGGQASAIWVAAPDLSDVPEDIVEAKLEAMCEGTRLARMWLSKQQSDPD